MRINTTIKNKWVAALRSGEFVQGAGGLRSVRANDDGRMCLCALGVLCELFRRENPNLANWEYEPQGRLPYSFMREDSAVPREVMKWADLQEFDPIVEVENLYPNETSSYTTVIYMNDQREMSFEQIANAIERCPLGQ